MQTQSKANRVICICSQINSVWAWGMKKHRYTTAWVSAEMINLCRDKQRCQMKGFNRLLHQTTLFNSTSPPHLSQLINPEDKHNPGLVSPLSNLCHLRAADYSYIHLTVGKHTEPGGFTSENWCIVSIEQILALFSLASSALMIHKGFLFFFLFESQTIATPWSLPCKFFISIFYPSMLFHYKKIYDIS